MKRIIAFFSCLFVFFACLPSVNAAGAVTSNEPILVSKTIEYLEDGTTIETAVYEDPVVIRASDYMKSGSKTRTVTNPNGDALYKLTVRGVFSVDEGVEATCTSATYSTNIVYSGWSCTSASATKTGNSAIANGTFKFKHMGIFTETDNVQVVLTCDDLGNLS